MTAILDASALLALIFVESGHEQVLPFARSSRMNAVNYSEVVARTIAIEGDPQLASEAVDRLEINIVPFDRTLAVIAAELRQLTRHIGASFADRACLALGLATGLPILSADRDWAKLDLGIDIRLIR
jgi:ribonuclease VapC